MKGDFSRHTFDRTKHYTQVLMQQGRVQVDADWNEQQEINRHLVETETRDVIGQSGVPRMGGGFEVMFTPDSRDLIISPGRIYVDGILCELEEGTAVDVQEAAGENSIKVKNSLADGRKWEMGQWVELLDKDEQLLGYFQIAKHPEPEPDPQSPDNWTLTFDSEQASPKFIDVKGAIQKVRRIITYTTQPDYPGADFIRIDTKTELQELHLPENRVSFLVYLDVWQRHITALDNPHIREVALGSSDTTTRAQTVWQVKILPIGIQTPGIQVTLPPGILDLPAGPSVLKQPDFEKVLAYYNELSASYAKAVKRHGKLADIHIQMEKTSEVLTQIFRQVTCHSDLKEWNDLIAPSTGMLAASTIPPKDTEGPCVIPPSAGYLRLENQLYRVEIHHGNDSKDRPPTFKWSRENGTVVTAITAITDIKGENIYVNDVGRDDNLGFAVGQWVEIIDDKMELKGLPGELVQIKNVYKDTCVITLESTPTTPVKEILNPKLRRWDQVETFATNDGVPVTFDTPQELEGGIQVQFSQGTYKTGDYWLIPARTGNDIEWPHDTPNDPSTPSKPIPQPPLGIQHHYCRLALLRQIKPLEYEIQDCRQRFPSLTSLAPLTQPALHVTGISWPNDDFVLLEKVLKDGLQITLDGVPVSLSANSPTFGNVPACSPTIIVTMEVADANMLGWSLLVNGITKVEGNVIHWTWGQQENLSAPLIVPQLLDTLHRILPLEPTSIISGTHEVQPAPAVKPLLIRVRVTLKGHTIWSEQDGKLLYLDGQAFGLPYTRADGKTPRIALQLPSGSGSTASDFESWFYPCLPPLQVKSVEFIGNHEHEHTSSAGIITFPQASQPTVQFNDTENISIIQITFNRPVKVGESIMVTYKQDGDITTIGGRIVEVRDTVVRFIAIEPSRFAFPEQEQDLSSGFTPYYLTVLGKQRNNNPPVLDAEYGTPLDGNYDTFPGEDFTLTFNVSAPPPQVSSVSFMNAKEGDGLEEISRIGTIVFPRNPELPKVQLWEDDKAIAVEITFSYPVSTNGMNPDGNLQCILLESDHGRILGNIALVDGNNALFTVADRNPLVAGPYRLIVCGVDNPAKSAVAVTAVDGKTRLDGGRDFVFDFQVITLL